METILFAVVPYLVIGLAVVGTIYRYRSNQLSWTTQSSQMMENRQQFLGSVLWHYAILVVFAGHLIGWLFPVFYGGLKHNNVTFGYTMEAVALGSALLGIIGLLIVISRRTNNARARAVTQKGDSLLLGALLFQVTLGILATQSHAPGETYFTNYAAPWLWSIITLRPDPTPLRNVPLIVHMHIVGAYVIFALIPFTRLVHILSAWNLVAYQWRPPQVVRWFSREQKTDRSEP